MSWVTNDVLTIDVASAMNMDDPTALGPRWPGIIQAASVSAIADLTKFLAGLGYTPGQIGGWDDAFDASRRLGLLYALQRGNPLGKFDAEWLKSLDPRTAIRDNGSIQISGIPTGPIAGASQVGGISSGTNLIHDHLERTYARDMGECRRRRCDDNW